MKRYKSFTDTVEMKCKPHHMLSCTVFVSLDEFTKLPVVTFNLKRAVPRVVGRQFDEVVVVNQPAGVELLDKYVQGLRYLGSTYTEKTPLLEALKVFDDLYEEKA